MIITGMRVVRDSLELMDTMPATELTDEIRRIAESVPGVLGVEKRFARKTGLQYHVDLHMRGIRHGHSRASIDEAGVVRLSPFRFGSS